MVANGLPAVAPQSLMVARQLRRSRSCQLFFLKKSPNFWLVSLGRLPRLPGGCSTVAHGCPQVASRSLTVARRLLMPTVFLVIVLVAPRLLA